MRNVMFGCMYQASALATLSSSSAAAEVDKRPGVSQGGRRGEVVDHVGPLYRNSASKGCPRGVVMGTL